MNSVTLPLHRDPLIDVMACTKRQNEQYNRFCQLFFFAWSPSLPRQQGWYINGTLRKQFPSLTVHFILSRGTTRNVLCRTIFERERHVIRRPGAHSLLVLCRTQVIWLLLSPMAAAASPRQWPSQCLVVAKCSRTYIPTVWCHLHFVSLIIHWMWIEFS